MRKLVLILIAFIAVVTFIRAYDNSAFKNETVVEEAALATFHTLENIGEVKLEAVN